MPISFVSASRTVTAAYIYMGVGKLELPELVYLGYLL